MCLCCRQPGHSVRDCRQARGSVSLADAASVPDPPVPGSVPVDIPVPVNVSADVPVPANAIVDASVLDDSVPPASPSVASASTGPKRRLLGPSAVDVFQQSLIVTRDCGDPYGFDRAINVMSHVLSKVTET